MGEKKSTVCRWCGKKTGYTDCSERHAPPDDARCKVLKGWLSVSHWKEAEVVDYHNFCSLICLQRWVAVEVPKIPETFLKAFEDEKSD